MRIKQILKPIINDNNKLNLHLPVNKQNISSSNNNIIMGSLLALATLCCPVKPMYNAVKTISKDGLEMVGADSTISLYKNTSKVVHIAEPICKGVANTVEFAFNKPKETCNALLDIAFLALGKKNGVSERLFNYLKECSQRSETELKQLLKELPNGSLADVLKYVNHTVTKKKNIPCAETSLNIALSNPANLKTTEYWTADDKVLDNLISKYKKKLPEYLLERFERKHPLVEFKQNGLHAKILQENEQMQKVLQDWAKSQDKEKVKILLISLEPNSDVKNGYDAYATFHNLIILNPSIDKKGNIQAHVYDIYDFDKGSFKNKMIDFVVNIACHLQETGHLKNYKMLIPISIPTK